MKTTKPRTDSPWRRTPMELGHRAATSTGDDGGVETDEIPAGNVEGPVPVAPDGEPELDGARLALVVSVACVAIAGESHGHGTVAAGGDETEAVGDELVVEDR
ncbi:hypothetical protein Scep_025896 [Stephania cephalantha]|uniref:Uncharacterized protein n=1 Tax=Stephania cephalantha TaxID=152367 RepID=A0AAP0EPC0_9MAGN